MIRTEEENFAKTIDGGMKIFSEMLENHKAKGETVFSGADAFKLYDTYGFPIDLTNEMVKEVGLSVDEDAFRQLMQEQKVRAREARKALGDLGWAGVEFGKEIPADRVCGLHEPGIGRKNRRDCRRRRASRRDYRGAGCDSWFSTGRRSTQKCGGQVADHGVIFAGDAKFAVSDVQKNKGGKFMHYGKLRAPAPFPWATLSLPLLTQTAARQSCARTRRRICCDYALRTVLGDHAHQAGSLVERRPAALRLHAFLRRDGRRADAGRATWSVS